MCKGNTAQFPPNGLSTAPADLRAKSRRKASVALRSASLRLGVRHGNCVAKMLDNTQSIICAFGLAAAAPRSPYRHLELCGIALRKLPKNAACILANAFIVIVLKKLYNGTIKVQGSAHQARPDGGKILWR